MDLALSPDGRTLVAVGGAIEPFIGLWDVASGRRLHIITTDATADETGAIVL